MDNVGDIIIRERHIGSGHPSFIIAEIGQSHDGSLGIAHSYIDAVAKAGADAIKFQTHIADAESTLEEGFRVKFSYQDKTRYDYWKRMEFTEEGWIGLAEHCKETGIIFLSSPFSVEAVELLKRIGIEAWKIGSGEVNNPVLLDAIIETKKPILLSTGMSNWKELGRTVANILSNNIPLAVFQCTSKYPTSLKEVGLNVLERMKATFSVPVGLSDHSGTIFPALAAMARGANLIEIHVVFSKAMFGPDTSASITLEDLQLLCNARDAFFEMTTHPVDKDTLGKELEEMKPLFNKSVALRFSMPKGTILDQHMLTVKKPGTGIPACKLTSCIGMRLKRDVTNDRVLKWEDLEANEKG